ncbi:MAG: hypothetical protein GXY83_36745 [Rhodopirellula sp.]|nr:hypothetical protein [Rhodopirellula sp.]
MAKKGTSAVPPTGHSDPSTESAARLREAAAKVRQVAGAFNEGEPQVLYKGWIALGPLFKEAYEAGAWQSEGSQIGGRLKRVLAAPGRDRLESLDGLETPVWKPEAYFAVVEPLTSQLMPPAEEKEQLELEAGIAADEIEEEARRIEAGRGEPSDAYRELGQWAAAKLRRNQRRAVELLAENAGSLPIADIASDAAIGWQLPYDDSVSSLIRELNKEHKLPSIGWRIHRHDNEIRLVKLKGKIT